MSTDAGIDLVVYASSTGEAKTVQVKANLKPKPGGGKGKEALDWWVPEDSPAELMALVDLSTERIWMFLKEEIPLVAQQHSSGRLHVYMYTDPTARPRKADRLAHVYEFEKYLLENRAHVLFGT